jgi:hypothetical protein
VSRGGGGGWWEMLCNPKWSVMHVCLLVWQFGVHVLPQQGSCPKCRAGGVLLRV